jgi:L-threonylcarbamoyladenylate synthase
MELVSKKQFLSNKNRYFRKIAEGAVFIYPTDTIYGIGCDATNSTAVKRVRQIKKRQKNPFSVAVPSKKWIRNNCYLTVEAEQWLKRLPGPYTLLLKLKNKRAVTAVVNPKTGILGIRIPRNWFADMVAELDVPIVSTSANITAESHMTSLKDLNPEVAKKVDFIVYDGEKKAGPSVIVRFYTRKAEIIGR